MSERMLIADAAYYLDCRPKTIQKLIDAGEFGPLDYNARGEVVIQKAAIDAFLDRRTAIGVPPDNVYFVQVQPPDGPIKIGRATSVHDRISSLQTGSPYPLHVLHTYPCERTEEKALHARFQHLRIHGEWFKAEPELLEFIDDLRD